MLLVIVCAGCGDVDWFPEYQRQPTTPDQFTIPAKTGVATGITVTSDPVTVAGLTAPSPISITGTVGSNSKYAVNNGTATDQPGTVSNGDRVTVSHTSSGNLGTSTTSTLTIGNISANFVSTTRNVGTLTFSAPTTVGGFAQAFATVTSRDGVVGTHLISIKDSLNSPNASFAVTGPDEDPGTFFNTQQTIPILNGQRIFVRNLLANRTATTTLTIDGVETVVPLQ